LPARLVARRLGDWCWISIAFNEGGLCVCRAGTIVTRAFRSNLRAKLEA
jgi:hypothetical protein